MFLTSLFFHPTLLWLYVLIPFLFSIQSHWLPCLESLNKLPLQTLYLFFLNCSLFFLQNCPQSAHLESMLNVTFSVLSSWLFYLKSLLYTLALPFWLYSFIITHHFLCLNMSCFLCFSSLKCKICGSVDFWLWYLLFLVYSKKKKTSRNMLYQYMNWERRCWVLLCFTLFHFVWLCSLFIQLPLISLNMMSAFICIDPVHYLC